MENVVNEYHKNVLRFFRSPVSDTKINNSYLFKVSLEFFGNFRKIFATHIVTNELLFKLCNTQLCVLLFKGWSFHRNKELKIQYLGLLTMILNISN